MSHTQRELLEEILRSPKCRIVVREISERISKLLTFSDPVMHYAYRRHSIGDGFFQSTGLEKAIISRLPQPRAITFLDVTAAFRECFAYPTESDDDFDASYRRFCSLLVSQTIVEQRAGPTEIRDTCQGDGFTWDYPGSWRDNEYLVWSDDTFQLYTSLYQSSKGLVDFQTTSLLDWGVEIQPPKKL